MRKPVTLVASALFLTLLSGCATLVLGSGAAGGYEPADGRTHRQFVEDGDISAAVTARLVHDAEVDAMGIQVSTYRGVVTLDGVVPDGRVARRVVSLSRGVPGVRRVVSKLQVQR